MRFPKLQYATAQRQMLDTFLGYNANPRIGEGEFAAMENMSSDGFPLLTPRKKRGIYARPGNVQGLIAKDSLCWVDGSRFVMNGFSVELGLSEREADCPKRMVSMGAYVIIFPDKKYINTLNLTDFGNLEAEFAAAGSVRCIPAGADGSAMLPTYVQPEEPENPGNLALWLDNSVSPGKLLQWSAGSGMWVPVESTFVRLEYPGIGEPFREGDGVTLEGLPEGIGAAAVVQARGRDYLVVPGLLGEETSVDGVTVSRKLPRMDYVIECGNRLWGCCYGMDDAGQAVNEIYASKLGDFRNWNCFAGTAADSYAVNLGADGPFTGAVQHMGYPVFFRENCLHKIYGTQPANFRLQTTPCRGVQRGSGESLAIVGEVLYYKSSQGICAYDGALPVEVSHALGDGEYRDAVAGSHGRKYYISMANAGGEYHLFVYDTARNLWHREDGTRVRGFCSCRGELYYWDDSGAICSASGAGEQEEDFRWMAETGDLGTDSPGSKYLCRLTLRLWLAREAVLKIWVQYDGEPVWHPVTVLRGGPLGSVTLPMGVRRCDHLRLRLEGRGEMRLYSLTKTVEEGSEVFDRG